MEKRFLDKVEDNAAIQIWSEKTQQDKGDSLMEGTCQNCGISLTSVWISTCSEPLPSIGIPPVTALLLER
ncbi:hypothetical protein Goarm_014199 [Gossypium armourianum]|uniref:Uncharacterized protein n=1 Tax=Gossypium armourianum TaxID=34283 RepID=A0A7J9J818_9ROSI|nr:hypothetical protein [Gossypium armourianum]